MEFKNELGIIGATFENGLFHFITEREIDVPIIIKYSKHRNRHFIFYNCRVIKESETGYLDQFLKTRKNYQYDIEYEMKFTSKGFNETNGKFYSYLRDKKLNYLLS